jgi:hypothetical protein
MLVIPPERDKSSKNPARAGDEESQNLCTAQIPRRRLIGNLFRSGGMTVLFSSFLSCYPVKIFSHRLPPIHTDWNWEIKNSILNTVIPPERDKFASAAISDFLRLLRCKLLANTILAFFHPAYTLS